MQGTERQVLVVGGGPTGLVLAGELALAGADVAIVERRPDQRVDGSRAGGLHARSLELLDQRGIVDRFLAEGRPSPALLFSQALLDLSDLPSRHACVLGLWQRHIERLLADRVLGELGVPVHRGRAVAVRDADTVARTLYRLGQHDQRVSLSDVRQDTIDLFNRYLNRSIKDVDSTTLVQEILTLGMKHRLRIPPEYTMLGRAGATIEGIVRELDPDIDVADVAKPYAERLLMDRVAPDNMQGGMYKALLQLQGMSEELPLQVSQILSDLSSGKLNVTVSGRDLERLTNTVLMSATTIAGAILGGAFVVGSFIGMAQLDWAIGGVPIVGIFGALVGATVMTWVGAYILLRPRLKKISLLRLLTKRR